MLRKCWKRFCLLVHCAFLQKIEEAKVNRVRDILHELFVAFQYDVCILVEPFYADRLLSNCLTDHICTLLDPHFNRAVFGNELGRFWEGSIGVNLRSRM